MKRLSFIFVFLFQVVVCLGQVFTQVSGECRVSDRVSYEDAVEIATDIAKGRAVEETCGVDVSTFTLLRRIDDDQCVSSKTIANSYAVVRVSDREIVQKRNRVIVTISGEVYKTVMPRAIGVSEPKKTYTGNDFLSFDVSFYKPSYIKIFWFDEETGDGGMLYPNNARSSIKYEPDNYPVSFPYRGELNYIKAICPFMMTQEDYINEVSRTGTVPHPARRENQMPQLRNANGGKWVKPDKVKMEGFEKHISIIFVTTSNNVPCNLTDVTEESFLEWWCALPYAERELPVKKHITLKM